MKNKLTNAPKQRGIHPYLAVYNAGANMSTKDFDNVKLEDIVVISRLKTPEQKTKGETKAYVTHLSGQQMSYFTDKELEYIPLPVGFKVELVQ